MKKTITSVVLILMALLGSTAFITKSSNGIAGYTASPGEATCSDCHGGGASSVSGITLTSVPSFSTNINSEIEYLPDSTYQIFIEVAASGFSHYGFGCEILNTLNTNAGTMEAPGAGVKFLDSGAGRRNAVHSAVKSGSNVSFDFQWVAPSDGNVSIYAIANAVNGNGKTGGDFVISPVSLNLKAAPREEISDVGIKENKPASISGISIYPNPATSLSNISYYIKESTFITIDLVDTRGTVIKQLYKQQEIPGYHSRILNLNTVPSGIYFVRTFANSQKVSQKLIAIE